MVEKIQVVTVILLVLAILFSAVSIALTIGLADLEPVNSSGTAQASAGGNPRGNVAVEIIPRTQGSG